MDSRQYIFSFAINSPEEAPADFAVPSDLDTVEAGVFLPRDDADWLGRRKYPARVLLLTGREVVAAAHPASKEGLLRIPLDRLETIECGRILLVGWIIFAWDGGRKKLPYNTRTAGPIEKFVQTLKDRWLPPAPGAEAGPSRSLGEPLDLKFGFARSAELLAGETPLVQFFHAAARRPSRRPLLRRVTWIPGDLVAVTPRRLLWITEQRGGRYERYGTVSRSAPWPAVAGVRCVPAGQGGELEVAFRSGDSWRVPFRDNEEPEARKLEAAIGRMS